MTAAPIAPAGWRGPGCGTDCWPRSHDPIAHERYGYDTALAELRSRIVRTGPLTVDLRALTVLVDGAPVIVPSRELQVLAYLAERVGFPCRLADLARAVYGLDGRSERNAARGQVVRLRGRLGDAGRLITSGRSNGAPSRRLERLEPT